MGGDAPKASFPHVQPMQLRFSLQDFTGGGSPTLLHHSCSSRVAVAPCSPLQIGKRMLHLPQPLMRKSVTAMMAECGATWANRVASLVKKSLGYLESLDPPSSSCAS